MNTRAHHLRIGLLLAVGFGFAACQAVPDNGRYAVSAMKAPFYKYGPAQAFGADFALVRGQHVTMIDRGFGFSRVLTDDGVSGFMSTDDIAPSPEPLPTPQPRVASRRGSSGTSGTRRKPAVQPEADAGLFNFNDVPLPTNAEAPKTPDIQPPKTDPKPAPKAGPKPEPKAATKPVPKPQS